MNKQLFNYRIFIWASLILAHITAFTNISYSQFSTEWTRRYSGNVFSGSDYGRQIAIDKQNNIYVAGDVYNSSDYDYALIKYNVSGIQVWVRTYNGTGNSSDFVRSLALDDFGNAYLTGYSLGSGTWYDCVTIKYDSSGNLKWINRYNYSINQNDFGKKILIDKNKNIYVCGTSNGDQEEEDYLLIKYDSSGTQQWVQRYNGINISDDAMDMVLDGIGNIYVTGNSFALNSGFDFYTIKYSADGSTIWSKRFDYDNGSSDNPNSIALDSMGNIYITGYSVDRINNFIKLLTIKYDGSGSLQWNKYYQSSTTNYYDEGSIIGVDRYNNVFVTGYTKSTASDKDFLTIKYKPNGDTSWVRLYNGPGNYTDVPNSLIIDQQCNAFITGASFGNDFNYDYYTICYDTLGNAKWSNRYSSTNNSVDMAQFVTLDIFGNLYITGASEGAGTNLDILTIKFNRTIGITEPNENIPKIYLLKQNYPNPFNPTTNISYTIPKSSIVKIVVFDMLGREVAELVNDRLKPGTYEIIFNGSALNSGVYFYQLIADDYKETRKMLLLK